jgi:hypothetical protein
MYRYKEIIRVIDISYRYVVKDRGITKVIKLQHPTDHGST